MDCVLLIRPARQLKFRLEGTFMRHWSTSPRKRQQIAAAAALLMLAGGLAWTQPGWAARVDNIDSPLSRAQQSTMDHAMRLMRAGKFERAADLCNQALAASNDVSKCISIAKDTEAYGLPMMETRRNALNRAYSLATSRDDLILVALKSREYQFFEVTRQAVASLIANAKTIPELYDLAKKSQEVALNDVAHLAMEKAYTGVHDQNGAFAFAEQAKAMGMDDLLRKVVKELVDDEDDVQALCDLMLKLQGYNMRDETRYGLRKCLDKASTIAEMQAIFETARRLNEPDIANRANYYVRKGKVIQKIKEDRAAYEAQLRGWREGVDIDSTAGSAAVGESGFSGTTGSGFKKQSAPNAPPTSGF